MEKTRKDIIISGLIDNELESTDNQEKYLALLTSRIDENRKTMRRYGSLMILMVFSFYLALITKISEISLGLFKLEDNSIAILLLPSIFSFLYYRYIAVWDELVDQKHIYSNITSKLFNIEFDSLLNDRIRFHSLIESIISHHLNEKPKVLGVIIYLLWLPIAYGIIMSPFIFIIYSIINIYRKFQMNTLLEWLLFLTPIVISFFTIVLLIKRRNSDINKRKSVTND